MNFHGNYCGPGWSAGEYQSSVESDVPAVDALDAKCKRHDGVYARGGDLMLADFEFARDTLFSGDPKSMLAGFAVGLQGLGRKVTGWGKKSKMNDAYMNGEIQKANLRKQPQTYSNLNLPAISQPDSTPSLRGNGKLPSTFNQGWLPSGEGKMLGPPIQSYDPYTKSLPKLVDNDAMKAVVWDNFNDSQQGLPGFNYPWKYKGGTVSCYYPKKKKRNRRSKVYAE